MKSPTVKFTIIVPPWVNIINKNYETDQQNKMAKIMKDIFKEKLLTDAVSRDETLHPR